MKTAGPWPAGAEAGVVFMAGVGPEGGIFGTIATSWRRRFRCQQTHPMPNIAARRTAAPATAIPTMAPVDRAELVAVIGAAEVCPGATGSVEVEVAAGPVVLPADGGEAEDDTT